MTHSDAGGVTSNISLSHLELNVNSIVTFLRCDNAANIQSLIFFATALSKFSSFTFFANNHFPNEADISACAETSNSSSPRRDFSNLQIGQ